MENEDRVEIEIVCGRFGDSAEFGRQNLKN